MMKLQMHIDFKLPGLYITDAAKLIAPPEGRHAFSRAALMTAISCLGLCDENKQLEKKLNPEIALYLPCPPLFNAFYDSGPQFEFGGKYDKPVPSGATIKEMFTNAEKQGQAIHGTIMTSDSLADTYLYISHSRHYLIDALQPAKSHRIHIPFLSKNSERKDIPKDVLKEISQLYTFWDNWRPKSRLDLSKSLDTPDVPVAAKSDELNKLVCDRHPTLVGLLFFILAHEYGHLLLSYDDQTKQSLTNRACELLHDFIREKNEEGENPAINHWRRMLDENEYIFDNWQTEVAADIHGLEWCMLLFFNDKEAIGKALSTLSLIISILETYDIRMNGEFGRSHSTHPVSYIRILLQMKYLSTNLGWNPSKSYLLAARTADASMKLQSQPALRRKC